MQLLLPMLGIEESDPWTGDVPLPGGDIPHADLATFMRHAVARWSALPPAMVERLARQYGTRMARILGNAHSAADLGRAFGDQLTLAEVKYLVGTEWARSAEDILWRRTRLGLELPDSAVHDLQDAVTQLLG